MQREYQNSSRNATNGTLILKRVFGTRFDCSSRAEMVHRSEGKGKSQNRAFDITRLRDGQYRRSKALLQARNRACFGLAPGTMFDAPKAPKISYCSFSQSYRLGVSQDGKKVLATIFDVCPRVALLLGLKYGRLSGGTHGSLGTVPHGYPDITPRDASLSMKS
jgi:hypothetical protein